MDSKKINEIEARLKDLIKNTLKEKTLQTEVTKECLPACNVIRRRKGEKDKRILVLK